MLFRKNFIFQLVLLLGSAVFQCNCTVAAELSSSTPVGDIVNVAMSSTGDERQKAIGILEEKGRNGNVTALLALGDFSRDGKVLSQDLANSLRLYREAYKRDPKNAGTRLGNLYYRNFEQLQLDQKLAITFYEEAAAKGNASAMAALGDVYAEGRIVPRNPETALKFYTQAYQNGSSGSLRKIGKIYYQEGSSLNLERAKAATFFDQAVAAGDISAKIELGDMYREGVAVPKDSNKAYHLYMEAAAGGQAGAYAKLGDLYYKDGDPLVSPSDALSYYKQGEQASDPRSLLALGDVYRDGRIAPRDLRKALAYYEEVQSLGNSAAFSKIGELYYRYPAELAVNVEESLGYYKKGIAAGDSASLVRLAEVYRDGRIVKKDYSEASRLYQQAFERGDTSAYVANVKMLLKGTPADQKHAVAMIASGIREKLPGIMPLWAEANLYGQGVASNPIKGLTILKDASKNGDIPSTYRLATLYTQGYKNVRKSKSAALETLKGLEGKIDDTKLNAERIVVQGAFATSIFDLQQFSLKLDNAGSDTRAAVISRVYWANPNAFVYEIQRDLRRKGEFASPPNGQLSPTTIASINKACRKLASDGRVCDRGPLSETVRALLLADLQD